MFSVGLIISEARRVRAVAQHADACSIHPCRRGRSGRQQGSLRSSRAGGRSAGLAPGDMTPASGSPAVRLKT
jgi:hypothetical protein